MGSNDIIVILSKWADPGLPRHVPQLRGVIRRARG